MTAPTPTACPCHPTAASLVAKPSLPNSTNQSGQSIPRFVPIGSLLATSPLLPPAPLSLPCIFCSGVREFSVAVPVRLPSSIVVPFSHGIKPARLLISTSLPPSLPWKTCLVQNFRRPPSARQFFSLFLSSASNPTGPYSPNRRLSSAHSQLTEQHYLFVSDRQLRHPPTSNKDNNDDDNSQSKCAVSLPWPRSPRSPPCPPLTALRSRLIPPRSR